MACQGQWSWRAFFFGGENPFLFASPQAAWPLHPVSFMAYRWVFAIYQLVVFIVNLVLWGEPSVNRAKYLIFISNWSFTILTSYTLWSAFATTYWHMKGKRRANVISENGNDIEMKNSTANILETMEIHTPTPWYFQVTWSLQVVSCSAECAVTVLFWLLEYDPGEPGTDFFTFNVHGVGLLLVTIDFFLVANPCRLLHFVWPTLYAGLYFLFTYVYYAAGGLNAIGTTSIYSTYLDWGESASNSVVVSLLATFVAAPVIHVVFFLFHLLKMTFGRCCEGCRPSTR